MLWLLGKKKLARCVGALWPAVPELFFAGAVPDENISIHTAGLAQGAAVDGAASCASGVRLRWRRGC